MGQYISKTEEYKNKLIQQLIEDLVEEKNKIIQQLTEDLEEEKITALIFEQYYILNQKEDADNDMVQLHKEFEDNLEKIQKYLIKK